jgi:hypothetical protein
MNVAILSSGLCRNPISTVKSFNLLKNHLIKNNIKFDLFYYTNDILGKHIAGQEPRIINKVDTLDKESLDYLKNNLNAVSFCVESYNETEIPISVFLLTRDSFTEVLTQDLNLRPRPALHVLGLSKTPGQAGSQVRGFRKTQVRSRS